MDSNNLPKSVESAHNKTWNAYLFDTIPNNIPLSNGYFWRR